MALKSFLSPFLNFPKNKMTVDVKFVVFVDLPNTPTQANQINVLNKLGYTCLVDSLHKKNFDWLFKNSVSGRFFVQEEKENNNLYMFTRDDLTQEMLLVPDFLLVFPDDKEISEVNWAKIFTYLENHLTDTMEDIENSIEVKALLGKPVYVYPENPETTLNELEAVLTPDYYNLETRYLEEDDIMLYEVTKPNTDLPYTSVTCNYSTKGHKPFFTDLFIAPSWGVSRWDIAFLKHTWEQFQMSGPFDLEAMMKEATEKCLPSENGAPEPEPTVYRRDIASVVNILNTRKLKIIDKVIPDFIKNKN